MSWFASSIINRLQDIVASNSQNLDFSQNGLSVVLTVPTTVTNAQDRKTVEKCYRAMDSVCHMCRQPGLNLKKSPPCIVDLLPEIYILLDAILNANTDILQHNTYLQLFVGNLYLKCKQTIRLFKEEKIKILNKTPKARRNLTMKALIFSHMAFELRSQFSSEGHFIGDKFRITKKEAAEFWSNAFQTKTIVPWEQFRDSFNKVHPIRHGMEMQALKSTIDLTVNDYVSNFEFDVFTRLFQPWQTLLKNWQVLAVTHPAYVAFLTYEEVKSQLQQFVNKPGSYVFRQSCTKLGQWAIGYVGPNRKIYQTIPQNKSLIQSLVDGNREGLNSFFSYIFPNGRNKNVDLSHALSMHTPHDRMTVTSEQYEIYCEMGTTFEICKICDERNKNIKLEPCGHLLCKPCLYTWEQSADGGGSCPFCRCEIKGTENIVIDSYQPSASDTVLRRRSEPPGSEPTASASFCSSNVERSGFRNIDKKSHQRSLRCDNQQANSAEQRIESTPQMKRPEIPPRGIPPPLPSSTMSSTNILLTAIPPHELPKVSRSEASEHQKVSRKIPSIPNASEMTSDPFVSLPNPFSEQAHPAAGETEGLPQFTEFMNMNLTRD